MKYTVKITKTPDDHDSNNVEYYTEDGKYVGYAYQSKDDLRIHIVRCPVCDRENYVLQKVEGSCYNCHFDPNENVRITN